MNMPASFNQDPEPRPSAVNVSHSWMRLFVNSKKEKIKCIAHVSHVLLMLKSSLLKGSLFPFFSSPFWMFTPGGTGYLQKWFHTFLAPSPTAKVQEEQVPPEWLHEHDSPAPTLPEEQGLPILCTNPRLHCVSLLAAVRATSQATTVLLCF